MSYLSSFSMELSPGATPKWTKKVHGISTYDCLWSEWVSSTAWPTSSVTGPRKFNPLFNTAKSQAVSRKICKKPVTCMWWKSVKDIIFSMGFVICMWRRTRPDHSIFFTSSNASFTSTRLLDYSSEWSHKSAISQSEQSCSILLIRRSRKRTNSMITIFWRYPFVRSGKFFVTSSSIRLPSSNYFRFSYGC